MRCLKWRQWEMGFTDSSHFVVFGNPMMLENVFYCHLTLNICQQGREEDLKDPNMDIATQVSPEWNSVHYFFRELINTHFLCSRHCTLMQARRRMTMKIHLRHGKDSNSSYVLRPWDECILPFYSSIIVVVINTTTIIIFFLSLLFIYLSIIFFWPLKVLRTFEVTNPFKEGGKGRQESRTTTTKACKYINHSFCRKHDFH